MEFRKATAVPNPTGNPDQITFVKTTTGKFDLYVTTQTGDRAQLDRVGVNVTSAGTPPADPRYGDVWQDTTTDHFFEWQNNGVGNYWMDMS